MGWPIQPSGKLPFGLVVVTPGPDSGSSLLPRRAESAKRCHQMAPGSAAGQRRKFD
jgi:hypothetical protein